MSEAFPNLESLVRHDLFPEIDAALRRGRHIDRDDVAWYAFLVDGQEHLEELYRRFGCELVSRTDGFFFLVPKGDLIGQRVLSAGEMVVGQSLALIYLSPAALQHGGLVSREQVLSHLVGILGVEALIRVLEPRRTKKVDQRIAEREARKRVADALRKLARLGFVEEVDAEQVRLRSALARFVDPVRGVTSPAEALARLIEQGEVAETGETDDGDDS